MPTFRVTSPDGVTVEVNAPEGATQEQAISYAQSNWDSIIGSVKPTPAPISTERTWGESLTDLGASAKQGLGGLMQFPGQMYGLATGAISKPDFTTTGLYGAGKRMEEAAQHEKSAGLKAREAASQERVAEADKEGFWSGMGQQLKEIATDPVQLPNFLLSQSVQSLPSIVVGMIPIVGPEAAAELKGLQIAAKAAVKVGNKVAEAAAKKAIQDIAIKAGTRQAIGVGAMQQGADIGSGTYEDAYKKMISDGVPQAEAASKAVNLAREAGASGAVISVLVNKFMPGANAFERAIAGERTGAAGRLSTGLGMGLKEGLLSEAPEEAGGRMSRNAAMMQIDPNQTLMEGVGSTTGQAIIGGFGLGAVTGGATGGHKAETAKVKTPEELKAIKAQEDFDKQRAEFTAKADAEQAAEEAKTQQAAKEAADKIEAERLQRESTSKNLGVNTTLALPAPSERVETTPAGITQAQYDTVLKALKQEDTTGMTPDQVTTRIHELLKDTYAPEEAVKAVQAKPQEAQAPAAVAPTAPVTAPPVPPIKPVKPVRAEGWDKDATTVNQLAQQLGIPTETTQKVAGKPTVTKTEGQHSPSDVMNILVDAGSSSGAKTDYGNSGTLQAMKQAGVLATHGEMAVKGLHLQADIANSSDPQALIDSILGKKIVSKEVPGTATEAKVAVPQTDLIKQIKAADVVAHNTNLQKYKAENDAFKQSQEASKVQQKATAQAERATAQAAKEAAAVEAKRVAAEQAQAKIDADALTAQRLEHAQNVYTQAEQEGHLAEKPPTGFDIKREAFKEGEAPGVFEIKIGDTVIPFEGTEAEANAKVARLQKVRDAEAAKLQKQVDEGSTPATQKQTQIEQMEAMGKHGTPEHTAAVAEHKRLLTQSNLNNTEVSAKLFDLTRTPITLSTVGNKPLTREGHTVYEGDKAKATLPTRKAAEEHILTNASEEQINALAASAHPWADRAKEEVKRRKATDKETGKVDESVYPRTRENKTQIVEAPARPEPVDKTDLPKSGGETLWDARVDELNAILKPLLKKLGLENVSLDIVSAIKNGADGSYAAKLIKIAFDATTPIRTLRHEGIHALKELGFFSDQQWKALEDRAKKVWVNQYLKGVVQGEGQTRYDAYVEMGLTEQEILEEAIADAFADFDATKAPPGMIAAILNRMRLLINHLKSAFTGAGYDNFADVFGKVEKGELKAGKEAAPGEEKASIRPLTEEQRKAMLSSGNEEEDWANKLKLEGHTESLEAYNNLPPELQKKLDAYRFANRRATFTSTRKGYEADKSQSKSAITRAWKAFNSAFKEHFGREMTFDEGRAHYNDYQKDVHEYIGEEAPTEKLSVKQDGFVNRYKPTAEDKKDAKAYEEANGILPYVPEPITGLPVKEKYSFKMDDKYGFDPLTFMPLNEDGTVTVYYHTTKQNSLDFSKNKVIPANGKERLYFTEEANGGEIYTNRGNMDQELDGSVILLNIDPTILQFDMQHDSGRMDFFVPMREGEFYNKKMSMKAIQASRKTAILKEFDYKDFANRITDSLTNYRRQNAAGKKKMLAEARKILRNQHNVATLLTENGKLERTRVGEYGLKHEGNSVASMGLGLASAQQISDRVNNCPNSAICEGLCLGETAGGNFLYGGAAEHDVKGIESSAFRGGPRMMQYLKTEAMLVNPEAFAIVLDSDIESLRTWCASPTIRKKNPDTGKMERIPKDIYSPAIRLNVTSDFRPEIWQKLMEVNKDVEFYDYTKTGSEPVAGNHHFTYSSTGFSQIVDGKRVINEYSNWNAMRQKLNRGKNVAMAFSTRDVMPAYLFDEETGQKFQVWDGDNYDARFLDPKPGQDGNEFGTGMIIGLTNKDANTNRSRELEKTAAEKYAGFFVDYDPKSEDKTIVVPDQNQFKSDVQAKKEEKRKGEQVVAMPVSRKEKLSLRSVAWNDDRVNSLLSNYSYTQNGREKDTKAYAARISPKDFLDATTPPSFKSELESQRTKLDKVKLANFDQPIYLDIQPLGDGTYKIKDHEGRHRMMALQDNGVDSVPVVLHLKGVGGYLKNAEIVERTKFIPQTWVGTTTETATKGFSVEKMIPINWENRNTLKEEFGGEADIKFSLRAPDTKEFKQFFGDSKVVDSAGNPLVVYHGTATDFTEFKRSLDGSLGPGIYFTADPSYAEAAAMSAHTNEYYGRNNDAAAEHIMPVYLSIQNPFDLSKNTLPKGGIDALKKLGFDGLKADNEYVAFEPTQIKSATGNTGAYSKTNPDIRYSLRAQVEALPNGAQINTRVGETTYAREEKSHAKRMIEALTPRSFSSFRQKALHRYNQAGVVGKQAAHIMGDRLLLADASAEAACLFSDNASSLAAEAMGVGRRKGGIPQFIKGTFQAPDANGVMKTHESGYFTVDNSSKGAVEIFAPLAAKGDPIIYQYYNFWAGVQRGSRFMADGTEQNFTRADIAYAKQLETLHPEFASVQKEWIKYNDGLVKMMVDAGVLTKEAGHEFTKHGDYLPFYRQLDGEATIGPNIFQSIAGVKPPKKHTGKTDAPIGDFLENVVRNTQAAIEASMKNVAGQRVLRDAETIGMAVKVPFNTKLGNDIVPVFENGVKTLYRVADALLVESMKGLNLPQIPFLGIVSAPANLLRTMVTKDPAFMLANMMRDSLSAWVTTGASMKPMVETIANFGKGLAGMSPEVDALRRAGILGGYDFAGNVETSGREFSAAMRKFTGTKTKFEKGVTPITGVWHALEMASDASEGATRAAVYKATLAKTGNEAEALFQAMEVLNFNRKGNSAAIRLLTAAVPFLNARMQGLDLLYRAGFGQLANADAKSIQKAFFVRGATIMAMSALYYAMTQDDDDYKKQEQETRDNYWLLPSLGVKIPIPFEVGIIFKVIPERIMAYAFGSDTGKDFMDSMGRQIRSTLSINYPQIAVPYTEMVTNYSFFTSRPIVSRAMEGIAPEFQVEASTSGLAKRIGKGVGLSPIQIDHLISGYTGTMGMYMVNAMNSIFDTQDDPTRADLRFEQLPVFKRFLLDKNAKGNVTAYYDLKHSTDEMTRTVNMLERTGNYEEMAKYQTENVKLLATQDYIKVLAKDMKQFQDMKMQVQSSKMDGQSKRDTLTAINQAEITLTANIQTLKKMMDQMNR